MSITKIREFREAAGLSQAALARRLGVDRAVVHRWDHGRGAPAARMLGPLCDALELNAAQTRVLLKALSRAGA